MSGPAHKRNDLKNTDHNLCTYRHATHYAREGATKRPAVSQLLGPAHTNSNNIHHAAKKATVTRRALSKTLEGDRRRTKCHTGPSANYKALLTRHRQYKGQWLQRPSERSDPTQHAKGRTGACQGPRKGATTRRNVTHEGRKPHQRKGQCAPPRCSSPVLSVDVSEGPPHFTASAWGYGPQ